MCMCVYACTCELCGIKARCHPHKSFVLPLPLIFINRVSHLEVKIHQFGLTGWPANPRNPPASASPALGVKAIPLHLTFPWVLGWRPGLYVCAGNTAWTGSTPQPPIYYRNLTIFTRKDSFVPSPWCWESATLTAGGKIFKVKNVNRAHRLCSLSLCALGQVSSCAWASDFPG